MTERHAQCGRTFVHAPHETTGGSCPGLAPLDPPLIARRDVPRPLDPSYAGQRRAEPGMMGEFVAAEPDPIRAWMLSYPAENTAGPGWGDDDDVEAGRCCPTCRASLTDHNVAVREGGRLQGVRDGLAVATYRSPEHAARGKERPYAVAEAEAAVSRVEALCDEWETLQKGPGPTTDRIRAALRPAT